jgi:hypothetical protein
MNPVNRQNTCISRQNVGRVRRAQTPRECTENSKNAAEDNELYYNFNCPIYLSTSLSNSGECLNKCTPAQ